MPYACTETLPSCFRLATACGRDVRVPRSRNQSGYVPSQDERPLARIVGRGFFGFVDLTLFRLWFPSGDSFLLLSPQQQIRPWWRRHRRVPGTEDHTSKRFYADTSSRLRRPKDQRSGSPFVVTSRQFSAFGPWSLTRVENHRVYFGRWWPRSRRCPRFAYDDEGRDVAKREWTQLAARSHNPHWPAEERRCIAAVTCTAYIR